MKTINLTKMMLWACAVMMGAALFSSCHMEPYDIPTEEIYLRNFIKKYGLIDPNQTWNQSKQAEVTVVPDQPVAELNIYVDCGGKYYRVANYVNVSSKVNIPLDIPRGFDNLLVIADGRQYFTEAGSTVDMKHAQSRGEISRATPEDYKDMAWLIVAEDLGATDDFDFNDIIVSIELVSVNYKINVGASDWQVIPDEEIIDITTSRAIPEDYNGTPSKRLKVKAMAAGGTLPLWLHFNYKGTDFILGKNSDNPNDDTMHQVDNTDGNVGTNDTSSNTYEWHHWFGVTNTKTMINTGINRVTGVPTHEATSKAEITIYVDPDFTLTNYSYVDYDGDGNHYIDDPHIPNWVWVASNPDAYTIKGFYITVNGSTLQTCTTSLYAPSPGAAPQMFLIPDVSGIAGASGWFWPTERTDITSVYKNFRTWVNDQSSADDWFMTPEGTNNTDYIRVE